MHDPAGLLPIIYVSGANYALYNSNQPSYLNLTFQKQLFPPTVLLGKQGHYSIGDVIISKPPILNGPSHSFFCHQSTYILYQSNRVENRD